jgi:prepilin-type N-terminal cleavage/methylation domain-containing protein
MIARLHSPGPCSAGAPRAGFTLAEVAVTIAIVGIALTLLVQGLNKAKFEAAQTRNLKVARELALVTLGEIAGGVYAEELDDDDRFDGTYADLGHPEFTFEVLIGDSAQFEDEEEGESNLPYDTVRARREREEEQNDDEDEEDIEEPYETVRIRVRFPAIEDFSNQLDLEQWMEWELIHGTEEDADGGGRQ